MKGRGNWIGIAILFVFMSVSLVLVGGGLSSMAMHPSSADASLQTLVKGDSVDPASIGEENESVFGVDLACNDTQKYAPVGGTAQYAITVKNIGNTSDTINLTLYPPVPPPCGWYYWLAWDNVTLRPGESLEVILLPGESTEVILFVSRIYFGSPCVSFSVTVTGSSQGDPTKSDSIETRTTAVGTTFDTGLSPTAYPSIAGTHEGTITPSCILIVRKLYIYSCPGTGGHVEYVKIWNSTGWNVTGTWERNNSDWHTLTFNGSFILYQETYNYTLRTVSYPQIIHAPSVSATGGSITCPEFIDVNGKRYTNWIPAIRLEY